MSGLDPSARTPEVSTVTGLLYSTLMKVMGLEHPNLVTRLLEPILSPPARRLSAMLVELDHNIPSLGWSRAVAHFLEYFAIRPLILGAGNIPSHGPLIVSCNHPAAYDVVILAATLGRDDLKIIASDIPLIQALPNISAHDIPVPYDIPARLRTVRSGIQHLKGGGALLIFPRGNVEPDPAVSPGAEQSLQGWSASLELFLRRVPATISTVAIASGILSGKWFKNPLIKLWRTYEQRQKVAEIFQIASQLITGKPTPSTPLVTYSPPLSVSDLGGLASPEGTLLAGITSQARHLLESHPHV